MVDACRIDHDVEAPGPPGRLSDESLQRAVIVQIEGTDACFAAGVLDRPGDLLQTLYTAPGDEDVATLACEATRDRFTNAG